MEIDRTLKSAIADLQRDIRKTFKNKQCYKSDAQCSETLIKAHSIQNNRILSRISEKGILYSFQPSFDRTHFELLPDDIGRNKASTFPGFCSKHDTEIFSKIELEPYKSGNKHQEFLFAYRVNAREYYTKLLAKETFKYVLRIMDDPESREKKLGWPTSVTPPEISHYKMPIKSHLKGLENSIRQMNYLRKAMNSSLDNKCYNRIKTLSFYFDGDYPIAVASAFIPDFDLRGNKINDLERMDSILRHLTLTVFPQEKKSYVLLSCYHRDKKTYNNVFNQISELSLEQKKQLVTNMILAFCENTFIKPSYWNGLLKERKDNMIKIYNSIVHSRSRLLNGWERVSLF